MICFVLLTVHRAAKRFGFKEVGEEDDWNLYWTDFSVSLERVMEMKRYQVRRRLAVLAIAASGALILQGSLAVIEAGTLPTKWSQIIAGWPRDPLWIDIPAISPHSLTGLPSFEIILNKQFFSVT